MTSGPTIHKAEPFLAFLTDPASLAATNELAHANGWSTDSVIQGTIETALTYLQQNPSPEFLLVEITDPDKAADLLDKLADCCDPGVKVLVTSSINQYSFFVWLKEVGVHQYLLQPYTTQQLALALEEKTTTGITTKDEKSDPSRIIAFMGTRGGVGTTTILSNIAYLFDKEYKKNTAILDMDIHFGTAAMAFDIEPTRGLASLLENPDRVDSLSLDRVMANVSPGLKILSAEEPLRNTVNMSAHAAETLLRITRDKYKYIFVDLPRTLTPFTRHILEHADQVVLVTELTLHGLRDLMRLTDHLKEIKKTPLVVANREGLVSKHEIPRKDFDKHYGQPVTLHIPCMLEAFSTAASGEMLVATTHNAAGKDALHQLARRLVGDETIIATKEEKKKRRWTGKEKS